MIFIKIEHKRILKDKILKIINDKKNIFLIKKKILEELR